MHIFEFQNVNKHRIKLICKNIWISKHKWNSQKCFRYQIICNRYSINIYSHHNPTSEFSSLEILWFKLSLFSELLISYSSFNNNGLFFSLASYLIDLLLFFLVGCIDILILYLAYKFCFALRFNLFKFDNP